MFKTELLKFLKTPKIQDATGKHGVSLSSYIRCTWIPLMWSCMNWTPIQGPSFSSRQHYEAIKNQGPRPQLQPLHTGKAMTFPLVFTWLCWDEVCLGWQFSVHVGGICSSGLGLSLIFGKIWRKGTGKRKPEEDLYSLSDSSWKTPWGFGNTPALGLQSSRCPS